MKRVSAGNLMFVLRCLTSTGLSIQYPGEGLNGNMKYFQVIISMGLIGVVTCAAANMGKASATGGGGDGL